MGSTWLLVFCILLAKSSAITEFQENELKLSQSDIFLDIFHVHGPGSPLSRRPKSSSFLPDMLARDQERVKGLNFRLAKKTAGTHASTHKPGDLQGPKSVSVPLKPGFSIGAGNYYAKIGLGTPVKYFAMLVDTGSSFSWLQCQPCTMYCHDQVDPLFDPSTSKTYKSLSCTSSECSLLGNATLNQPICDTSNVCTYTASYGDSSRSIGYLSQDLLTLSPKEALPGFLYGCGQDNEGLFGMAAGILGLARNKLSMLAQLSTTYGYAFSYCLPSAEPLSSSDGEGSGGFLSIGKTSLSASSYKFTPMFTDSKVPDLYYLRMVSIAVDGKPLGVTAVQYRVPTIIDSGTVITRLPAPIYTALQDAFVKVMSKKYTRAPAYSILDTCFKGSPKSMTVPEVKLTFQGDADLELGTSNILIEADKGVSCLAFASNSEFEMIAIVGNRQQQTFKVAYDITNSRIGFAAGGCQ